MKKLQDMLLNKTYKTSEYETFIKHDTGKDRKIYKLPYYPDRIAQWAILQVIEPIFDSNTEIDGSISIKRHPDRNNSFSSI